MLPVSVPPSKCEKYASPRMARKSLFSRGLRAAAGAIRADLCQY